MDKITISFHNNDVIVCNDTFDLPDDEEDES